MGISLSKSVALLLVLVLLTASYIIVSEPAFSQTRTVENSWELKFPMQQARSGLGAAVVNGKIYAIGGTTLRGPPPYTGGPVGTNEEYDPATDRWSYKTPKPTSGGGFGIAVYQNKIYCISYDVNEVYDPVTDTWEIRTPMPTPRHSLEASVVDGKIYLIGGYDPSLPYGGDATNVNEVYDPETDTWSTRAPMLAAKRAYASAVVGDKIHIIGGDSLWAQERNLNQIYDTKTDSWSYGAPFPHKLYGAGAGVTSGVNAPVRIYVFGAMRDTEVEFEYSVRVYDPESDSWRVGADIPTRRSYFGVAVVDDLLYLAGGETSSGDPFSPTPTYTKYATNERYTPFGYGTIPPLIDVVSPENQTYNVTSVSLDFTVNKAVSWMGYSLDSQENVTVMSNTTLAGLASGLHNVTVFARDEFENTGASETLFFTVELPLPKPFPTLLVATASGVAITVVAVCLLYYRKKRNH
jgi:N-acetylneuraminic acid mutarotase